MRNNLWLQALLVVSLAFNIASGFMYVTHSPPSDHRTPDAMVERMTSHMSHEDAAIMRGAFDARRPAFDAAQTKMDLAFDRIRRTMSADPLDVSALKEAMERAHDARQGMEETMRDAILEAAPKLSPEGRLAMLPPPHH